MAFGLTDKELESAFDKFATNYAAKGIGIAFAGPAARRSARPSSARNFEACRVACQRCVRFRQFF
jgi:hypothetical protein